MKWSIGPAQLRSERAVADRGFPRLLGIFAAWRLQAYGYALAASYAVLLVSLYKSGFWIVDTRGVPLYSDFICPWVAGVHALHGDTRYYTIPPSSQRSRRLWSAREITFTRIGRTRPRSSSC